MIKKNRPINIGASLHIYTYKATISSKTGQEGMISILNPHVTQKKDLLVGLPGVSSPESLWKSVSVQTGV